MDLAPFGIKLFILCQNVNGEGVLKCSNVETKQNDF